MPNLYLFANNAASSLLGNVGPTDTAISLPNGEGARFPNPAVGQAFLLTIEDTSGNYEIVEVTARTTDVLTVVRGREGTAARSFTAGAIVECRVTAGMLAYLDWQTPKNAASGPLVLDNTGKAPIATFDTPLQVYGDNRWNVKLNYTPPQQGTGIGQTAETLKIGWSAANKLKATVNIAGTDTDEGNFAMESWVTGTATAFKAATLATPRAFSLTGVITAATINFDGSGAVALATAIADNALTIAKTSGLQAALDSKLASSGNVTINGSLTVTTSISSPSITDTSDIRVKENVEDMSLEDAIAIVRGTRPVRYYNTLTHRSDIGLIAQWQKETTPELVNYDESADRYSVAYQRLVAPYAAVINHLLDRLDALETARDAAG